jgi:hypothetical protein
MSLKHTDSVHRTYRHQPKSWGSNKRLFYSLPKNKKDEASIVRILSSYEKLTDSDKLRVKKSLHYFVHHSRESDPNIQFKDNSKLADFLRLFQLLKLNHIVKGKELPAYRLTLSHRYENGSPERFNAWRYWEETSGILPEYKSNRTKKSYPAEHGLLGLSVLSKKPKTSSRVGARRQASWGFRLGLYVLSVIELSPEQLATYDVVM